MKRKISSFVLLGLIVVAGFVSYFMDTSCKDTCSEKAIYILMGAVFLFIE